MKQSTHSSTKNWNEKWTHCDGNYNYYKIDEDKYIYTITTTNQYVVVTLHKKYRNEIEWYKSNYELSYYTQEEIDVIKLELL